MIRKHELQFAQKAVKQGLVDGEKMLECIQWLNSEAKDGMTLMDVLIKKEYLSLKKVRQIEKEIQKAKEVHVSLEGTSLPKVGGYRLLNKIGEGAMGVVYKAIHEKNKRVVALKILDPELAQDQEFIKRFFT